MIFEISQDTNYSNLKDTVDVGIKFSSDDRFMVVKESDNKFSSYAVEVDAESGKKNIKKVSSFENRNLDLDSVKFFKGEDYHCVVVESKLNDGSVFMDRIRLEGNLILK
jgi:hypothetical protein